MAGHRAAPVRLVALDLDAAVRAAGGHVAAAPLGAGIIEFLEALGVAPGRGRNAGTVIQHRG
jgi:hypothetical protein